MTGNMRTIKNVWKICSGAVKICTLEQHAYTNSTCSLILMVIIFYERLESAVAVSRVAVVL